MSTIDITTLSTEDAEAFFLDEGATEIIREARLPSGFQDPYPVYKRYRAAGGVVESDLEVTEFGGVLSLAGLLGEGPVFTAVRFDEVAQVLSNYGQFTSTAMEPVIGLGRNMLVVDPPEHKHHRLVVQSVFGPRAMEDIRTAIMEPVVAEALDDMAGDGGADLMAAFINEYPVTVIGKILGLPLDDLSHLQRLAEGMLLLGEINSMIAMWAYERIGRLFADVVEERRTHPSDDLVSYLCTTEIDGESLSVDEVSVFLRLLLPAGVETTFRALGSLMVGLLSNEDQLAMVREDPSLIARAVDESLRWEAPVNGPARLAVEDVELGGCLIPKGAAVQPAIHSANHDEHRFKDRDPDAFDIGRAPEPHIAFGFGPHLCLGSHLAKMEMQVALAGFLDRLPRLRLDEAYPAPTITGTQTRGPTAVHVRWD